MRSKLIYNGIPWFDDRGKIVNAHGACIVEDGGRYYLFGEYKTDDINHFNGFSCYSSDDLANWKFERLVLPKQQNGLLGPGRIGERVKVMKCPATGEYVMYMHTDDTGYCDPHIGYATCKTIAGDYEFKGAFLYEGEPIRRWDMGTFQDADGKGYLLIHHGIIYRLSDDYRSAEAKVLDDLPGSGESPAMFRKNGLYYLLNSNLTSWEKNDNFYYTASDIGGPWTRQGLFAPERTLTYNSQTTFVFPLVRGGETIPVFMGDRWSYPHQASAATYVWLPMRVDETKLSIPEYWQCWDINTLKPAEPLPDGKIIPVEKIQFDKPESWQRTNGRLSSNIKDARLIVPFEGTQIAITGETNAHGGYALVSILNGKKEIIHSSVIDFYSKYPDCGVRFLSPRLSEGGYTLAVEVTGEQPVWYNKKRTIRYGSGDCFVTVSHFRIIDKESLAFNKPEE
jgi:hypothetical protein